MTKQLRELFGYSEQLESAPSLLFSGVKSVNLAFLVEIRYCFFIYAPAEVSGRVQFLDRIKGLDEPRQVTGPVDHRDQGSRTNYFFSKKIAKTSLREFFIKKTQKALNVIHNNSIIP